MMDSLCRPGIRLRWLQEIIFVAHEGRALDLTDTHFFATGFQGHADAEPERGAGLELFRVQTDGEPGWRGSAAPRCRMACIASRCRARQRAYPAAGRRDRRRSSQSMAKPVAMKPAAMTRAVSATGRQPSVATFMNG